MLATLPPPPRLSLPHPCAPAYFRSHRPPCSSSSPAALAPPTSCGNFHPSAPTRPHAPSALAICGATAAFAPDSTDLRPTSSAAGSAHSLPNHRRSPSAPPLTSARTALLPPRNTSCALTATLALEISSASSGSTPAPRYRVSAPPFPLLDSAWPSACSADSSSPSALRHLPVSVRRFLLLPISRPVVTPCSSSLSFPIRPPVETSRLGDISIVVISSLGDISNVAAWGPYQSRATGHHTEFTSAKRRQRARVLPGSRNEPSAW